MANYRKNKSHEIMFHPDNLKSEQREYLIQGIESLLNKKSLPDYAFAALFLILYMRLLPNYLRQISHPLEKSITPMIDDIPATFNLSESEKTIYETVDYHLFFLHYQIKRIKKTINEVFINWIENKIHIELRSDIPSPTLLLKRQADGKRVVSILSDKKYLFTLIRNKRDVLSFMLHDLMHADKFFNHPDGIERQIVFYQLMIRFMECPHLKKEMDKNTEFKFRIEYATADMNAYCGHLLKYLWGAFDLTADADYFKNYFKEIAQLTVSESGSFDKLNTPNLSELDEKIIYQFFTNRIRRQHYENRIGNI